jgi:HlyD family secretion protein
VETAQAALAQEYAGGQVAEGALVEAEAQQQMADAALVQQEALRQAAEAALAAARIDVDYREAAIAAAAAHVERIRTDVADSTLTSPIRGRVLYRVAEPGEVLAAGGKVVTVLELSDVYMTIFLPTEEAGRAVIGAEGRIVLDAAPGLAIPAAVSFVAPRAQFTPKEVETRGERDKLMFRVKVRIDPELLARHADRVKTGLPGVAYVRLDGRADWPEHLRATLPR